MVKQFLSDKEGSATPEYGLIAAGLSLAIIAILQGIAIRLSGDFAATRATPR